MNDTAMASGGFWPEHTTTFHGYMDTVDQMNCVSTSTAADWCAVTPVLNIIGFRDPRDIENPSIGDAVIDHDYNFQVYDGNSWRGTATAEVSVTTSPEDIFVYRPIDPPTFVAKYPAVTRVMEYYTESQPAEVTEEQLDELWN